MTAKTTSQLLYIYGSAVFLILIVPPYYNNGLTCFRQQRELWKMDVTRYPSKFSVGMKENQSINGN